MFDEALPFWSTVGQDAPGLGFVEQVTLDSKRLDSLFKRTRVQARQVYTFCHAAELGWKGPAIEAARNGINFIIRHAWLPDGGWARKLGPHGEMIDETLDAYEQAFVLFAFGWVYRLTGYPEILAQAHRTIDVMYQRLAHPGGLGFLTEAENCTELQQNPHMHYLEAMLVLYQASGEVRFADEAKKILRLLRERLYQPERGVLLEFFDLDWKPAAGDRGRIVEPGHHFEWVWLLHQCQQVLQVDSSDIASALFAFAEAHGSDRQGVVYDALLNDGSLLRADHRTWPQTEALKAYIAMAEVTGKPNDPRIEQLAGILLDRYLATTPRGIWVDYLDQALNPLSKSVPASTLYHVFLAFAELQRWAGN